MSNWIYTTELDTKLKNYRSRTQNAIWNFFGKQMNTANELSKRTLRKLENVAGFDNAINGLNRSVDAINKMKIYAFGALKSRVKFSSNIINDTINNSVYKIENSLKKIDRRIKRTQIAFSNLQQFSLVLCIMMFCVYYYNIQFLETLTQVLLYPSIIGIILILYFVIDKDKNINTSVFMIFFLSVIFIKFIYYHKNSKAMFKGTVFEYDNLYIEFSFFAYYTFLYNQQQPYGYEDYKCISNTFYSNNSIQNFTLQGLPFYILAYLLSFKYSFKIFEFEYLLAILVIFGCILWFAVLQNDKYEYISCLVLTLDICKFYSVLISIWTFVITFFFTTILPESTLVGNLIKLISFSSFLLWFLKYENSICNFNYFGVIITHIIIFSLSLLISLIIKLDF